MDFLLSMLFITKARTTEIRVAHFLIMDSWLSSEGGRGLEIMLVFGSAIGLTGFMAFVVLFSFQVTW